MESKMEKQTQLIGVPVFSAEGATECVTLTEAKTHLYIDTGNTDFDTRLTALITEARQYIEAITGRSLISRTVTVYVSYESEFGLPYGPLVSFTSASAKTDINEYETQILNEDYEVENGRFISYVGNWRFKLVYTAGYSSSTIPGGFKLALLNEIAKRFEHRGDVQVYDTNDLVLPYKDVEWTV
jgi:uncharacterized phiE125 gp8 family phage protein